MRSLVLIFTALSIAAPCGAARAQVPNVHDSLERWTHESGATVLLAERHDFPYITFDVSLKSGAIYDPKGRSGLAGFTAKLMTRGAGGRDRGEIDTVLDRLGTELEVTVDQTGLSFEGDGLSRHLPEMTAVLGDVLQRPDFPKAEMEKLRRELESEALRVRDNDRRLNRRFFKKALYGAHPYARPADGTLAGIKSVTAGDVRAFYKKHFVARNIIIGLSGDITRSEAEVMVSELVGGLSRVEAPTIDSPALPSIQGRRVLLVDKPDRTQNQILLGHLTPNSSSDANFALLVANTVFGGTFTARLNHEVRDQRGLSYGAYSYLSSDAHAGTFSMWTFPASSDGVKTVKLLFELFESLGSQPLTDEEVDFAKRYLVNAFAFDLDTPAKLVAESVRAELEGLPRDHLRGYVQRVNAVTTAEVNAAIQAHLKPENFLLTMLCTAPAFEDAIKALPGVSSMSVVKYDRPF